MKSTKSKSSMSKIHQVVKPGLPVGKTVRHRPRRKPTLEAFLKAQEAQIDGAISEMIFAADQFFEQMPAQILTGADGIGYFALDEENDRSEFSRFFPWFQRWLSAMEPESDVTQRTLRAAEDKIEGALNSEDPEIRKALNYLEDGISWLCYSTQEVAYAFGMMVGSRFAGASRERMLELAKGFYAPRLRYAVDRYQRSKDATAN